MAETFYFSKSQFDEISALIHPDDPNHAAMYAKIYHLIQGTIARLDDDGMEYSAPANTVA
ncbi:MAG: hypothetical protein AAGA08_11330 [Pseudomonadota bacterium]